MPWNYRVTKCEVCRTKAVVMISARGRGLCAKCGSDPDGAYYEDATRSNWDKLIANIGEESTRNWYNEMTDAAPYPIEWNWKQINDLVTIKLDSLECTCNERNNATCPACVALLRAQEVEA